MESVSSAARSPSLQPAQSSPKAIVQPAAPAGRDLRLDFFRGLSLWFIFLDHVPSNLVAWFTSIAAVGSIVGSAISKQVPQQKLRQVFGYLLIAVSLYVLYRR